MMEAMSDWALLFVLLFAAAAATGVLVAVIAFVMIRNLSRRVEELERGIAPAPPPLVPPRAAPVPSAPRVAVPAERPRAEASPVPVPPPTPHVSAPPPVSPIAVPQREPLALPPPPPRAFDWERWLGVRGAAVFGGVVLAIAGFLFVQYSIERQWIGPEVRVALAALAGIACLALAHPLRRRGYVVVADSVTGAGAVLMYAASWATHMYGWVGYPAAFVAMAGVTAVCAYLAHRHASAVIAVIGLVGGFATPIVLSSGENRPFALFGYVLLLDLGFLLVAEKRRWPAVGLVALGGTLLMQALWIFLRMGREDLLTALLILGVFALLFVVYVRRIAAPERTRWNSAQISALVSPFVFAIWFAQDRALSEHVTPLLGFAALLAVGAAWAAGARELAWLPVATASGGVALAATWVANRQFTLTWEQGVELAGGGLGLVALHAILHEVARTRAGEERAVSTRRAAVVVALGLELVILFAATRPIQIGPPLWFGAGTACALAIYHAVGRGSRPLVVFVGGLLVGVATVAQVMRPGTGAPMAVEPVEWIGLTFAGSALLFAAWLVRFRQSAWTFHGVLGFVVPATLAVLTLPSSFREDVLAHAAIAAVLLIQGAFAAAAARSSPAWAVVLLATLFFDLAVGSQTQALLRNGDFLPAFALLGVLGVLFAWWPLLRTSVWTGRPNAWRFTAAVLLPLFLVVDKIYREAWPEAPVFVLPLSFELLAGVPAARLFALRATEDRARRVGRIWFTCAVILFAAMIVPLQVDREVVALTLALFAAGVALFHVRVEARALAWVAVTALGAATFVLVGFRLMDSFEHSPVRVWNWLAYTHLLPGVAAIVAATSLRRAGATWPASLSGVCALLLVFGWLNLEIADAFASGERFTLRYEHTQTRDLTVSLAWVAYALVLLVLGVTGRRTGLRWASLVLLLLTIGKVFLFDLGHLQGLHRAASVAGLGVSLLVVSLLYQRFVFRRVSSAT